MAPLTGSLRFFDFVRSCDSCESTISREFSISSLGVSSSSLSAYNCSWRIRLRFYTSTPHITTTAITSSSLSSSSNRSSSAVVVSFATVLFLTDTLSFTTSFSTTRLDSFFFEGAFANKLLTLDCEAPDFRRFFDGEEWTLDWMTGTHLLHIWRRECSRSRLIQFNRTIDNVGMATHQQPPPLQPRDIHFSSSISNCSVYRITNLHLTIPSNTNTIWNWNIGSGGYTIVMNRCD